MWVDKEAPPDGCEESGKAPPKVEQEAAPAGGEESGKTASKKDVNKAASGFQGGKQSQRSKGKAQGSIRSFFKKH